MSLSVDAICSVICSYGETGSWSLFCFFIVYDKQIILAKIVNIFLSKFLAYVLDALLRSQNLCFG